MLLQKIKIYHLVTAFLCSVLQKVAQYACKRTEGLASSIVQIRWLPVFYVPHFLPSIHQLITQCTDCTRSPVIQLEQKKSFCHGTHLNPTTRDSLSSGHKPTGSTHNLLLQTQLKNKTIQHTAKCKQFNINIIQIKNSLLCILINV